MTRRGRPTGHKPNNIGRRNRGRSNPCAAASALVRQFFAALDADGRSMESVATAVGCSLVTLSRWRNGHSSPQVFDFECACQALGFGIALEKLS